MSRRRQRKKASKRGLPPGTPVFIGEERDEAVSIQVLDYDAAGAVEHSISGVDELRAFRGSSRVSWINVNGVHDVRLIEALCGLFEVHVLVQEDIVHTGQRPKTEDYRDYLYVVLHMIQYDEAEEQIVPEQVSLILTGKCVITFQEREGDVFDAVRERIRTGRGRVRQMGSDYLFYALLDAVVDHAFVVLERLSDRIDQVETEVMNAPQHHTMERIHRLKTDLLFLRRSIWPLREAIGALQKLDSTLMTAPIQIFLRDLYDHTFQLIDTVETNRDIVSGLFDIYLSSVSNRMNEVMKVLTVIATIFIPLTFVAGVYGMNFAHMPELAWRWGYPLTLALMGIIAAGMLVYFRRKNWL